MRHVLIMGLTLLYCSILSSKILPKIEKSQKNKIFVFQPYSDYHIRSSKHTRLVFASFNHFLSYKTIAHIRAGPMSYIIIQVCRRLTTCAAPRLITLCDLIQVQVTYEQIEIHKTLAKYSKVP